MQLLIWLAMVARLLASNSWLFGAKLVLLAIVPPAARIAVMLTHWSFYRR